MFPCSPHPLCSAVADFPLAPPDMKGASAPVAPVPTAPATSHLMVRGMSWHAAAGGPRGTAVSLAAHYTIVAVGRLLVRRSASSAAASPLRLCNTVSPRGATWTGPVCDLPLRPFASSDARS